MVVKDLEVYIVNTEYSNGEFEINAVYQNKEKAEQFVKFMKSHQNDFPEKQIKNIKIDNFIVL